jgi:hypothetical protein
MMRKYILYYQLYPRGGVQFRRSTMLLAKEITRKKADFCEGLFSMLSWRRGLCFPFPCDVVLSSMAFFFPWFPIGCLHIC